MNQPSSLLKTKMTMTTTMMMMLMRIVCADENLNPRVYRGRYASACPQREREMNLPLSAEHTSSLDLLADRRQ
jgi:hypothetical protein